MQLEIENFHPSLVFAHIVQSKFKSHTEEVSGHQNNQNTSSVQLFVTYDECETDQCASVCKVHLICVQLCATMKVICVQLTGRRAADQLSPLSLFPTFPPPPSHKNVRSTLTPQLLLLKFVTLLGGLRSVTGST